MKQKVVIILLIFIAAGAGYFVLTKDANQSYLADSESAQVEGIRLGDIEIDYAQAQELQKSVDEGHQPWRLDPLAVAETEALAYGFEESDSFVLKSIAASAGVAEVETAHKDKVYIITLVQPLPGENQIWVMQAIKEK